MVLGAMIGATREFVDNRKKEKQEERKYNIEYVLEMLAEFIPNEHKQKIETKISKMYDGDKNKFYSLKQNVEMLSNFKTVASNLIERKIMTDEDIRNKIQKHKKEIENVLGMEIELV